MAAAVNDLEAEAIINPANVRDAAHFAARRQAVFDASDDKEESDDEQAPVDEQAPKLLPLLRDPIKDVTNPQRRCSLQSCRAPRDPRSP